MPNIQIANFNPRQRIINLITRVVLRNGDVLDREQLIDFVMNAINANGRNIVTRPAVNLILDQLIQQGVITQS